jgi:hypothetical protein
MSKAREERRAANRAQFAALNAAYRALPRDKRELCRAEYALHKARSSELNWQRFLAVALPMLPADVPESVGA